MHSRIMAETTFIGPLVARNIAHHKPVFEFASQVFSCASSRRSGAETKTQFLVYAKSEISFRFLDQGPHSTRFLEHMRMYHGLVSSHARSLDHSRFSRIVARKASADVSDDKELPSRCSVSGLVYRGPKNEPRVTLFTREGCTLCDKVVTILQEVRQQAPHELWAVDITDPEHANWYAKYKYDIPVLHLGGKYWTKHRLTMEEAAKALHKEKVGEFVAQRGEPDAERFERKVSS
jgi:glutaredoxin